MNEAELQQNTIEDLLLIERALFVYKDKLTADLLCVPALKEPEPFKIIIREHIELQQKRTARLMKENTKKILAM